MSLDTLNPDIRDSVKEAARRAGMSVEQWVAATISDRAQRTIDSSAVRRRTAPAAIPVAQPVDELDAVAAKIARLAQGKPVQGRDLDTLLATASAETDRRSRENAAKTAVALDAVARWIEGAENRIDQTTRTTAARQERTTAVLGEALGLMTRRLEEIERKFESGSQPALDKALKAIERVEAQMTRAPPQAPPAAEIETALRSFEERIAGITERIASAPRGGMGRRGLSARDELKSAVADIRVRKAELDDPDHAPPRRIEAPEALSPFGSGALDALRADIARLAGQLETVSSPSIEPAAKALQGEMAEMQRSLSALATRGEVGALEEAVRDLTRLVLHARNEGGDVAAVTAPIQELQAEVRRLSEIVAAGVHGRLAVDLEGLARKIDGMAGSHADSPVVADLARQFGDLRSTLVEIAEPHRVAGLAEQMGDLSRQVAQIGRSQVDALEFASLRAAVDEIRSHMRAAPRDGALQSAAAREIAALSAKLDTIVERLPNGDVEAFARMVETLSAKIDGVAAASARGPDLSTLDQRLADIAGRLDRVSAAPSQVSEQIRSLSERMDTALLRRNDPIGIEPIVARLDRLDESLRRQPAAQPDLKPLEDMLRGLAERIDGGERNGVGDDGLDALERQVSAIAERLDRSDGTDPALSALQRAMGDLMVQVEGIRDDNYGLAERAAANAVATTLQTIPTAPGDLSDFKRDMDDLKALHGATDRRNRDTLEAVHTTLEKLVERLASLETENARPRPAPRSAQPKAAPQDRDAVPDAMAALAQEALRKMDAAARAQGIPAFQPGDADRPLPMHGDDDEILWSRAPVPGQATTHAAAPRPPAR
jgi:localization factor PodJL